MMHRSKPLGVLFAIVLAAAVVLVAFLATHFVHLPKDGFFPSSLVTHSVFLLLSLALMAWFSKGRLAEFGFTFGSFRPSWGYFAWVVPPLIMGLMGAMAVRSGQKADVMGLGFTRLQVVVFIWLYSSICEEILTRGLLQTLIERACGADGAPRPWLNPPVVVSGLFFGAMHLVLVPRMGATALPIVAFTIYLGLVAAHYRQKTASLAPAILFHILFNIAGSLPAWVAESLR
jgi:membrane protease YdiL (CAAX protease family)